MKRSRTICLILESVSAIALFLPWCYLEKYYSHGTNTHTYNQNFFGGLSAGGGVISYIVLLLMLVSIAWLVKGIISGKKISLLEFLLPIFSLVFLAISVFFRTDMLIDDGTYAFWRFDLNWLLYIIIAMQIATIAIIAIGKFIKREE